MKTYLILALALTGLLLGGFIWWFQPGWLWTAGYAGLSLVALGTVPLSYWVMGYLRDDQANVLRALEEQQHEEMLSRLSELSGQLEHLGVEEAAKQAGRLQEMLEDFHEVVANRFKNTQITSSSYMDIARRVQRLVLQNLSDMVAVARSVSSIKQSDTEASRDATDEKGQGELQKRLDLAADQHQRLESLTHDNRTLLTALAETSVEVANIQEMEAFERTDALDRLRELAERAKQYSA